MPRTMPRSTAQITGWSVATVPNGQCSLMMRSPMPAARRARRIHVGGEAVRGEGVGDGLHRRPQRPLPGGQRVAGEPGGHRPAVLAPTSSAIASASSCGQPVERPPEQRQHEVVAAHRDAGVERRRGDGDVALRRAARPALTAAPTRDDDLDVAAGGELVEVVAGDVGVHADLGGDGRGGDAVGAARSRANR